VDHPNVTGKYPSKFRFIINILRFQTKVALDRIAVYLDEDEVDEQVSSLKGSHFGASTGDDDTVKGLGIQNGAFKWNEVEQDDDGTAKAAKSVSSISTDTVVQETNDETEHVSISVSEASEHRFELRDVNVMFPECQLSVVTGPTASGKTALLVSLGDHTPQGGVAFIYICYRWPCWVRWRRSAGKLSCQSAHLKSTSSA
jgi:hypothetical protein